MKLINRLLQKYFRSKFKGVKHKPLDEEIYRIFRDNGEGLYYVNIWSRNNTIMARLIGLFSKGISHTVPVVYSENMRDLFNVSQWAKIIGSWIHYYREVPGDIKVLVLPSADDIGLVACDFSRYQNRKISIRKVRIGDQRKVVDYLVSRIGRPYDSIGLVCWLLGLRDDPYSDYCSEVTYDGMKAGGVRIAGKDNPSPAQIEEYNKGWIVATQEVLNA